MTGPKSSKIPSKRRMGDEKPVLHAPFTAVISRPANAMVYGEGGIKSSDLLSTGLVLMVLGCLLVALTGPSVLKLIGVT